MILTKYTITALRSRVASAIKRADELTTELCPAPTRLRVAADVTATVDLMIADAVELLSSAGYALQQVEPKLTNDHATHSLSPSEIGLIARADQKISHSFDLLNQALQMIEGERTIWGRQLNHGDIFYK